MAFFWIGQNICIGEEFYIYGDELRTMTETITARCGLVGNSELTSNEANKDFSAKEEEFQKILESKMLEINELMDEKQRMSAEIIELKQKVAACQNKVDICNAQF